MFNSGLLAVGPTHFASWLIQFAIGSSIIMEGGFAAGSVFYYFAKWSRTGVANRPRFELLTTEEQEEVEISVKHPDVPSRNRKAA